MKTGHGVLSPAFFVDFVLFAVTEMVLKEYQKRSVFDLCNRHARQKDWSELVPAMRGKVMRFEVVDEEEWEQRLNALLG